MTPKDRAVSGLQSLAYVLAAYVVSAALFVMFSLYPEGRVWGFNLLAYFPRIVLYVLIPVLVLLPVGVYFLTRNVSLDKSPNTSQKSHGFLWFAAGLILVSVALFYLFRTTTHFDGDGYLSLSNLYGGAEIVKYGNFGATGLQVALYSVLGKGGEATALFAYQIVSYLSGALFLAVGAATAVILFESFRDRALLLLGLAVGGYSLQFFGYVENYSLFIVSVLFYLLVGILIIRERFPRWIIIAANLLALFLHIFGLLLIPASIYLLLRKTPFTAWLGASKRPIKLALLLAGVLPIGGIFLYFYLTNYFFRFAFLPLIPDQFTASGYTIFSVSHLIDIANLMILLCPGLLVLMAGWWTAKKSASAHSEIIRFLTIAAWCAIAAVLIFDPKLGMPRDWDVFAFAGVPLTLFLYVLILGRTGGNPAHGSVTVILAILLSTLFLSASVAARVHDNVAISRTKSFFKLDPVRNRNNEYFVSLYFRQKGDALRADEEQTAWKGSLVDDSLSMEGFRQFQAGRVDEGMAVYRKLLRINPFFSGGYYTIGRYFVQTNHFDSAREYFRIGLGMQPDYPILWKNLGWVEARTGDFREAEKCWLKAAGGDSAYVEPRVLLLGLYKEENRPDDYLKCLISLAKCPDAPADKLLELAGHYCEIGKNKEAESILAKAMINGLDSAQYNRFLEQYPGLRPGR